MNSEKNINNIKLRESHGKIIYGKHEFQNINQFVRCVIERQVFNS